jgi:beta-lactamase regulating signal transducer with metallopeptidase domain
MIASLATLIGDPYAIVTGWTLLLILWETTIVGIFLAVWRTCRPHQSAREQHTAAAVAFSAALILAAFTPLVLMSPIPPTDPVTSAATFVQTEADVSVKAPQAPPPAVSRQSAASISADLVAGTAAIIWLIGVGVLAVRLAGGWGLTRSIRRRAAAVEDEGTLATARRLAGELHLSSGMTLLQSHQVEAPVVIGWRRPALILPADVTERLSPEMLSAVLTHELAHIQRRDYLANVLQSIVEVLLFFSPAVTWMSRRIREAREYCCDDVAIEKCDDPKHYINALTTLAALGTINPARPVMGAAGPRLITRVRRLLQANVIPRFSVLRLVGFAVALVVLAVSGVRVTTASASRAAELGIRATTASASGAARLGVRGEKRSVATLRQDPPPYGYVPEQEGSGVVLRVFPPTPEAPLYRVSIRNTTDQRVAGVRVVAAVERFNRGFFGRMPIELFVSDLLPVSIEPGEKVDIAPRLVTSEDLQRLAEAAPDAHLQLFFGLSAVRYANGFEWSNTPNSAARSGSDVFKSAPLWLLSTLFGRNVDRPPPVPQLHRAVFAPVPQLPRALFARDANRPPVPYGACRDDRDRAYSHGAAAPLLGEPGRSARCEDGRWVESAYGR